MQKTLAAKGLVLALALAGQAWAGAIQDEIGGAGGPGATQSAPYAAGSDRPMRTAVSLNAIQAAFDNSDPRDNVVRFDYDPNMTYKLRLREFMDTVVVLPEGEAIQGWSLGDQKNFTVTPNANKADKKQGQALANVFSVSGKYPGADTSLAMFGRSGRIYSFYLRVDSVKSPQVPVLVAYIDPAKPVISRPGDQVEVHPLPDLDKPAQKPAESGKNEMSDEDAADVAEYLRSLPGVDPKTVNLNYKVVSGDKTLAPIRVFDNGYWTFFQFSRDGNLDKVKRLPTIYRVVDGYDTPVNTRVEGGTLIAETTNGAGWTLRNGEAHLCIRASK